MTINDGKPFESINDWPTVDFVRQYRRAATELESQCKEWEIMWLYGFDHSDTNEIAEWLLTFSCEVEHWLFKERRDLINGFQDVIAYNTGGIS